MSAESEERAVARTKWGRKEDVSNVGKGDTSKETAQRNDLIVVAAVQVQDQDHPDPHQEERSTERVTGEAEKTEVAVADQEVQANIKVVTAKAEVEAEVEVHQRNLQNLDQSLNHILKIEK